MYNFTVHLKTNHVSDSWMQYRLRQFYLDVSELPAATSSTSQRVRCYTDNTIQPNVPPNIIDIPCRYTARYVIVETTYDAPEDNKFGEIGPILEICEIEIYGIFFMKLYTISNMFDLLIVYYWQAKL